MNVNKGPYALPSRTEYRAALRLAITANLLAMFTLILSTILIISSALINRLIWQPTREISINDIQHQTLPNWLHNSPITSGATADPHWLFKATVVFTIIQMIAFVLTPLILQKPQNHRRIALIAMGFITAAAMLVNFIATIAA